MQLHRNARFGTTYILAQSGVPMILPSSGSIGNNGALTLTTALPATYSGGCYMYFPANAIAAGVPAGLYYVVMSSTTVGTIYNNTYSSGTPAIPASPTAFVTTGPGAYTQTTATEITLASITVPPSTIGSYGTLRYSAQPQWNNSAGAKVKTVKFGGTTFLSVSRTTTTNDEWLLSIRNQGEAAQVHANSVVPTSNITVTRRAINTAQSQAFAVIGQVAVATDYILLESFSLEVMPS